eukprot:scpid71694/ scgid5565/ Transcription initiation factor TFIID subunit 8; TBP-associated factor 8
MAAQKDVSQATRRRTALNVAVAALAAEAGFQRVEKLALETLTEMLQSYIMELGRSAHYGSELSCRTRPNVFDVELALADMGADIGGLRKYAFRPKRLAVNKQNRLLPSTQPKTLRVGNQRPHPSHIPSHLPAFPDPHTYVRSPAYRKPVVDHASIREGIASQQQQTRQALAGFMVKTRPADPFSVPGSTTPLASVLQPDMPTEAPYLKAIMPCDEDNVEVPPPPPPPTADLSRDDAEAAQGEDSSESSVVEPPEEHNPYLVPAKKRPQLRAVLSLSKQKIRIR